MELDRELVLDNGRKLRPGVEFTARLPTHVNRGKSTRNKTVRLRFATWGMSPSTGKVYITGREVGEGRVGRTHSVWMDNITTVHNLVTPEPPRLDIPKPRPRRGR